MIIWAVIKNLRGIMLFPVNLENCFLHNIKVPASIFLNWLLIITYIFFYCTGDIKQSLW